MGVPKRAKVPNEVHHLVGQATEIFTDCVQPIAKISEISREDFKSLYGGENLNGADTPLEHIYPEAQSLAVYSLTLGPGISQRIKKFGDSTDVAMEGILDAVASVGADNGAANMEDHYFEKVSGQTTLSDDSCVLAYSPGYCGWHMSGQRKLFKYLNPEEIGITLNQDYLMTPIKSISGVLVAGPRKIHYFKPHWSFCKICKTYSCLQRMKGLTINVP